MKPITLSKIVVGASVALVASALAAGEITLFEREGFQGRRLTIRGTMSNLDRTDFNDRAESIIVRDGVWEVCSDARFSGQCTRLQPGEYPHLRGSLDRSISSAREVGQAAYAPPAPAYGGGGGGGGQPRAILYSGQGLSGRTFEIDRNVVRNLDGTGFNDRASSLSVLGGYWMFCSDANFEGSCRTFGPGDYPNLPSDLDHRISSGRRIADRYPYEGRPTWQR
jgi:Beta/Gamma crystallin